MKKQDSKIIEAGTAIALEEPTDQDKAFLARQLVQTTLPHSDPGNVPVWSRKNGNLTLTIQQGYDENGEPYGHPFGTLPRLVMYWMTTEAVRTKSKRLELGDSLAGFMEELGLDSRHGGKRSDAYRLKEQMNRLFEATISFTASMQEGFSEGIDRKRMVVAEDKVIWWNTKNPRQRAIWSSYVVLSDRFHEAITANPVPVDLRALRAIKRSPLALDLYSLMTYQSFQANLYGESRFMSWRQLQKALGTSYTDTANLRKAIHDAMKKIQTVYNDLAIGSREGGIEVLPESLPSVAIRRNAGIL